MRVLLLHNRYRLAGGEDGVFQAESDMLRSHGVEVLEYEVDNGADREGLTPRAVQRVLNSSWSRASYDQIRDICDRFRPDVAHVHNFWMTLSPSVHAACHSSGVATVQTLHNFRLLCANALFLRQGRSCQDCMGKMPWWGIVRRCYRDSALASATVTAMIGVNRWRQTWTRDVDAFIALSQHSRLQFLAGQLPSERIFVKPNFLRDPGEPITVPSQSDLVVYAGRLAREKGVDILLTAWAHNRLSRLGKLVIVGEGDRRKLLEQQAENLGLRSPDVVFVGLKSRAEVSRMLAGARALVLPSLYFETFGLIVLETLAAGRPAIVSDHGALRELVEHGKTGLTVPPGNAPMLGNAIERLLCDPKLADRLGRQGREDYLTRYTNHQNIGMLLAIYEFAIKRRKAHISG